VSGVRPVLLAGGDVVDGTGAAARRDDVLVVDGRIGAIGVDLDVPAGARVVDVAGYAVTPGFIDIHSHADMTVLAFPTADSALRQGVTTIVTGNCGGGPAPLPDSNSVGAVAFAYDPAWGIDVDWADFGSYAARLDGAGVNVAPLVAHAAVRNVAMGLDQREATAAEVAAMCAILDDALDAGAFGMSTGLEYQPGMWAAPIEIRALVEEVGARGRMYATHMRDRAAGHGAATAEAIAAAHDTGAHLQLSHFASRPNATAHARADAFGLVEAALADGDPIGVDTFPEIWGPALLIDLLPTWTLEGSAADVLARLRSPAERARIEEHFVRTPRFLAEVAGYERIHVTDAPRGMARAGESLTELAARLGTSVAAACIELLLAAGGDYRAVAIRHVYATDEDLERTLALPCCSIASDGVVTSGEGERCELRWSASTYGYCARTLEHFVREKALFTFEEAVRRMTSLPARQLGLARRGTVEPGSHADLVVVDPDRVRDRSTPDDMARHPTGIEHVLVNGAFAVEHGKLTPDRHGRLLAP
jgi:N-acyl-D-aspartate/D-glutamate deacylase